MEPRPFKLLFNGPKWRHKQKAMNSDVSLLQKMWSYNYRIRVTGIHVGLTIKSQANVHVGEYTIHGSNDDIPFLW